MKTILAIIVGAATIVAVHSQAQAPGAAAQTPVQQLQAIRDANVKLLEQQARSLEQLIEMDKVAQQIKVLGKRS